MPYKFALETEKKAEKVEKAKNEKKQQTTQNYFAKIHAASGSKQRRAGPSHS